MTQLRGNPAPVGINPVAFQVVTHLFKKATEEYVIHLSSIVCSTSTNHKQSAGQPQLCEPAENRCAIKMNHSMTSGPVSLVRPRIVIRGSGGQSLVRWRFAAERPQMLLVAALALLTFPATVRSAPAPLQLRGEPGKVYVIEASTDLQHWVAVSTTQADAAGWVLFRDAQAGSFVQRFYRGRLGDLDLLGAHYRSTGNPTSWNWNFDDGATSTARSPTHIYLIPGDYTATLTVRNSAGNTSSKSAEIRATLLP